jgi:serine/alanine adding enzyme
MNIKITKFSESDHTAWDAYVHRQSDANLYHLSAWKKVIEKTYGHNSYYLMAVRSQSSILSPQSSVLSPQSSALSPQSSVLSPQPSVLSPQSSVLSPQHLNFSPQSSIIGILPLIHMRHFIFGNKLVSIPFFDMGGILADTQDAEQALLAEAIDLGRKLKVDTIEMRHTQLLPWLESQGKGSRGQGFEDSRGSTGCRCKVEGRRTAQKMQPKKNNPTNSTASTHSTFKINHSKFRVQANTTKVRMLLELPGSSDELMKSFKSKLRSQIRRPIKEGLTAKIGGLELLDDFYAVFCVNMRDLGSPVHSKRMMHTVSQVFAETARLVVVYKEIIPVACSLVIGFEDTLENPWASSLREFSRLSPNMLLYWIMLAYACDSGYRFFDFGRSTPGEGTYKFKEQWGAEPHPLHWQTVYLKEPSEPANDGTDKDKFSKAIGYWQKLPVGITRLMGPVIRKHIAL